MSEIVNRLRGQEPSITNYWGRTELEQIAATEIERLEAEVSRLTNLAQDGRKGALEEAAQRGYITCAETRHVTLGDKVRSDIRALIPQEQGEKGK